MRAAAEDDGSRVSVHVMVYVCVVGTGLSHVSVIVLVITESVGAASAPAPIMLAIHAEGSKLGVQDDGVVVAPASPGTASEAASGAGG